MKKKINVNKKNNRGNSSNNKRPATPFKKVFSNEHEYGAYRNAVDLYSSKNNFQNNIKQKRLLQSIDNAPRPVLDLGKNIKNMTFTRKTKKYQKELEILINLYLYEKIKFNSALMENHNNKKFYIIDKSWLSKYKSFYDYQYIEKYCSNQNIENNVEFNIEKIISNIPEDYGEKINQKNEFLKPSIYLHEYKQLTKKTEKKNYKLLINYVIIDQKLFELFDIDTMIEVEIQKINNNKEFLISFNNAKYDIQLGYFNMNEFIPTYFFDYNKNNIDALINWIQSKNFVIFKISKKNYCELDPGYCYKVIDQSIQRNKNIETDILSLLRNLSKNIYNLDLNIISNYTCINCDSEIEITKINICNNKKQENDIIEYNCYFVLNKIIILLLKNI